LKTIECQALLTAELQKQIEDCNDRRILEDLYLPFKPKRRIMSPSCQTLVVGQE